MAWAWLVVGAVFLASFLLLAKVYAYIAIAFVLAYTLEPLVSKLEKKKVPRGLGDALVLGGFFVVLAGFFSIAVPLLIDQARDLGERLPKIILAARELADRYLSSTLAQRALELFPQFESLLHPSKTAPTAESVAPLVQAGKEMASPFSSILGNVLSSVAGVLTGVLGLFVIPLLAFYLLRDFPKLGGRLMRIIPRNKQRMVQDLRDRLDLVLGGFLRGQLLVSGLLSTYYVFAFLVLGIDLALVLGVLAGVLNLVPYVGIMIVIAMTTLLALLHGATAATFIALGIVFAIGMAVEGVFLTPKIVGNRVGLRPLSILIALMCGGELFGFVGMLLAIPTAATVKVFIEYWIEQRV